MPTFMDLQKRLKRPPGSPVRFGLEEVPDRRRPRKNAAR